MSPYQRHRLLTQYGSIFIGMYLLATIFLHAEPFPFFDWTLYCKAPLTSQRYEVLITALAPGVPLETPLLLSELKPEYRQDWLLSPQKIMARFGRAAMGGTPEELDITKRLLENYIPYNYAEYELVMLRYDPQHYLSDPTVAQQQSVMHFTLKRGQP